MDDAIETLLEEERRLILSGGLAGLADLAPRKEGLLTALAAQGALSADVARAADGARARLAGLLARNQALLRAALDGVRDAARRRSAMAEARAHLSTYDAAGARPAPPAIPRVERRA